MKLSVYQYVIWWTCPVLQFVIAAAMIRRKQTKRFPVYFWYTVFHVVQFIVAYTAYQISYSVYFYIYWATEIIDAVFTLVVIQEIFSRVFEPYRALQHAGTVAFRWGTTILCICAVLSAAFAPGGDSDKLLAGLDVLQRSIELIEAGLFLVLFLFSKLLGISWRHYVFGISLGFGVSASIALVAAAIRSQFGVRVAFITIPIVSASYAIGILIWTYYLVAEKTTYAERELPSSGQLHDWNEALEGILRR